MTAAILSAALVAGCDAQNAQNTDESAEAPAETSAAADEAAIGPPDTASSDADNRQAAARSDTTRPGAQTQTRRTSPAPSAARPEVPAPRGEGPATQGASDAPPARAEYRELRVPSGTALPLELQTALSSETATVEMPVRARLTQAISVDGVTVLPAGTQLIGEVTDVAQAGRVKGLARVTFTFTEAVVAGAREKLVTEPVTFEAQPTKGEDATKIGVGAGVGAAIGGILGGGSGAAKGAAIGGAAGTGAVLATKGQHVQVAEGANIAATLAQPFTLRARVQ